MFNKNFYPTPYEVIQNMTFGLDLKGKTILEPSAGKGNIVDYLNIHGAKEVLTYEKEPDLSTIVKHKSNFLGYDFLEEVEKSKVSHIDLIIANPPFSNADEHILKMWEIAPEGCQIISLCNMQTIQNGFSRRRRQLELLLSEHGEIENLGDCFSTAERKTNIEVSLIKLFKPVVNDYNKFQGFFMDQDEEPEGNGIMPYNEIRSIVQHYVGAVEQFDVVTSAIENLNKNAKPIGASGSFNYSVIYGETITDKERFAKSLQKTAWNHVFRKMNIEKFVTSGVMNKVNDFVEQQTRYPFTMKNIYKMIDIIIQTRKQTFEASMIDVFDKITKHHHDNRYEVEGWKTNKSYLVGKKFILDWVTEHKYSGAMGFKHRGNIDKVVDFQKALNFLTGHNLNIENEFQLKDLQFGQWFEWGFFQCKGFKKGTLHVKFKDKKVWEMFNRKIAEIKGFQLPERF